MCLHWVSLSHQLAGCKVIKQRSPPSFSLPRGGNREGITQSVQGTLAGSPSLCISLTVLLTAAIWLDLRGKIRGAGSPRMELPAGSCFLQPGLPRHLCKHPSQGGELELLPRCLPWAHPPQGQCVLGAPSLPGFQPHRPGALTQNGSWHLLQKLTLQKAEALVMMGAHLQGEAILGGLRTSRAPEHEKAEKQSPCGALLP